MRYRGYLLQYLWFTHLNPNCDCSLIQSYNDKWKQKENQSTTHEYNRNGKCIMTGRETTAYYATILGEKLIGLTIA